MMGMLCYRNEQVVRAVWLCSKSEQWQSFYDDIYGTESRHEEHAYLVHAFMRDFYLLAHFRALRDPLSQFFLLLLLCKIFFAI